MDLEREAKRKGKLICPKCDTEMIQGGDHDAEDHFDPEMIVSNFSCNTCETFILMYWK